MPRLSDLDVSASKKYHREADFNGGTHYVVELFLYSLPRVETTSHFKVIAEAIPQPLATSPQELSDDGEVISVKRPFDFDEYWDSGQDIRGRKILDFLYTSCQIAARSQDWDEEPFAQAKSEVERRDFRLERMAGKAVSSPDRRLKAYAWFESGPEKAVVQVRVADLEGKIVASHLVSESEPHSNFYTRHLGRLRWTARRTVQLQSKNGKVHDFELSPGL